jgi:hypothetical protein
LSLQKGGGLHTKTSDLFNDSRAAASSVAGMYTVLCSTACRIHDKVRLERKSEESVRQNMLRDEN